MKATLRIQSKVARLLLTLGVTAFITAFLIFFYAEQGYIIGFIYGNVLFGVSLGLTGAAVIVEKEQYDMNKVLR